ncbi:MAG TPA: hypothetical protein PLJ84_06900 [Bacteroidales bacterium]|nr:hypothetical protein [Bacteroidales bacterium]HPT02310.1 hypothetical protein [Bacteroidales bacterium]
MNTAIIPQYRFFSIRSLVSDAIALAFICLVPAISHLSGVPVYFIEPMRLMLILAILSSHKANAYALAIILPLVSFLVSGHPEPLKMAVIMAELLVNTWLFYLLLARTAKPFISMLTSIVVSKIFCYTLYLVVFSLAFVKAEAGTVFLVSQLLVTLLLSVITYLFLSAKQQKSKN